MFNRPASISLLCPPLRPRGGPLAPAFRHPMMAATFSTTPAASSRHSKQALASMLKDCPPYPYPIKHTYKKSWFGLFDGKHLQFGNSVPDEEYAHKTRRTWKPNVKHKRLWSKALGQFVQCKVVTSVLRTGTIDKVGGLDEYLLSSKPARIAALGPWGWKLRHTIMQRPEIQQRFQKERIKLGLISPERAKEKFRRVKAKVKSRKLKS
ncbi:ribosomal L28 family-domain-containing protein [Kalaharituber pfeilii]|nr:ribosomal L28 family-domain-containing protein [Kalaharituber pfeilii]